MATKKICDACGNDMTDDPATGRLAFDRHRNTLELTQLGEHQTWPHGHAVRVEISKVYVPQHDPVMGKLLQPSDRPGDVCSACIVRAVTEGTPVDLGPVTR